MIKSWMVIGGIVLLVLLGISRLSRPVDNQWFNRLQRPQWLTFEWAIPFIWMTIFTGAAWSAVLVWEAEPGSTKTGLIMGLYLLLEIVTMAYTPVLCRLRSLKAGVIVGGTGAILCILIAISVWQISRTAAFLLLPYICWSPIGTYTTWAMIALNPDAE